MVYATGLRINLSDNFSSVLVDTKKVNGNDRCVGEMGYSRPGGGSETGVSRGATPLWCERRRRRRRRRSSDTGLCAEEQTLCVSRARTEEERRTEQ
uniref:Uncharacterized protein n=1 Tax=Knipowitschia caucasica TaxID=637954 RepID=A0AAV2JSB7_KNICA